MWEYASVWAVARRTGLDPYIPRCLRKTLEDVFSGLSVPGMGAIAHCPVHWHDAAHAPEHWTRNNQSIVLPRFVILPEIVLTWVADIRQEFKFRRRLQDQAQSFLRAAAKGRTHVTFIGVHVRRTDYINYLWRTRHIQGANETYYKQAMVYFRERYDSALFVVVSDDVPWCRERLLTGEDDVILGSSATRSKQAKGTSASQDLALLARYVSID